MLSNGFSDDGSDDKFVIAVCLILGIVAIASTSAYIHLTNCPKTITLLGPQGQPVKVYHTTRHSIKAGDLFSTQLSFTEAKTGGEVHLRNVSSYAVSGCLPSRE